MAEKSSKSPMERSLRRVSSSDIAGRQWTEAEKRALQHAAEKQAAGDDSDIDFSDIPALTEEQLSRMVRLRDVRFKATKTVRRKG